MMIKRWLLLCLLLEKASVAGPNVSKSMCIQQSIVILEIKMNVLHVSLGLPPLRTGGLIRYCVDLMEAQVKYGHNVSLVYPGRFLPGKVRFLPKDWNGLKAFELINPLPVALTYGVAEPLNFIVPSSDSDVFRELLESLKPDVIHVHSYMGIYEEFFRMARMAGIPIVLTTHDYYPICPRCTLVAADGQQCPLGPSPRCCSVCCRSGMTLAKSMVMQSRLYALFKSSHAVRALSKLVKNRMESRRGMSQVTTEAESRERGMERLLVYNRNVVKEVDLILANSDVAEKVYKDYFPDSRYRLMRITHSGLYPMNGREIGGVGNGRVPTIGYFGGKKAYKGFDVLMSACALLYRSGVSFKLCLYGDDYRNEPMLPWIDVGGHVPPEHMRSVLKGLDAVVVPSIYSETFGFVVLEAICEGVRVICSDAVGAKDLVSQDAVFPRGDVGALAKCLSDLIDGKVKPKALPMNYPLTMEEQVNEIDDCYREARRMKSGSK